MLQRLPWMTEQAVKVFGEERVADFRDAYYESDKLVDQRMSIEQAAWSLRAEGLSPTEAEIREFKQSFPSHRKKITCEEFLAFAAKIGEPDCQMDDLSVLFMSYDPRATGYVSQRQFRRIMQNIGDTFTKKELDEFLFETGYIEEKINYTKFLRNLFKHEVPP